MTNYKNRKISIKNRILYGLLFSVIAIVFVTIKTVYFEISPNGNNAYWEECIQYDEYCLDNSIDTNGATSDTCDCCISRGFVTSPIGDRLKKQISRSFVWFWMGFILAPLFMKEKEQV